MIPRTESYEVDPARYKQLGWQMDNRSNGSNRFVTFMLTLIALLLSSAIGGAVVVVNDVASIKVEVKDLQDKINLIIEGRIRVPEGHN